MYRNLTPYRSETKHIGEKKADILLHVINLLQTHLGTENPMAHQRAHESRPTSPRGPEKNPAPPNLTKKPIRTMTSQSKLRRRHLTHIKILTRVHRGPFSSFLILLGNPIAFERELMDSELLHASTKELVKAMPALMNSAAFKKYSLDTSGNLGLPDSRVARRPPRYQFLPASSY